MWRRLFKRRTIYDTTHFFSKPTKYGTDELANAIARERNKMSRRRMHTMLAGMVGGIASYTVGYRVLYMGEECFIPLRFHKQIVPLNDNGMMKELIMQAVMARLCQNEMMREEYGIPLSGDGGGDVTFRAWYDSQDVYVIDGVRVYRGERWYQVGLCMDESHIKKQDVRDIVDGMLRWGEDGLNEAFEKIEGDGWAYSDWKIRSREKKMLFFDGKVEIDKGSVVMFSGRQFQERDKMIVVDRMELLRQEPDGLIRYILVK